MTEGQSGGTLSVCVRLCVVYFLRWQMLCMLQMSLVLLSLSAAHNLSFTSCLLSFCLSATFSVSLYTLSLLLHWKLCLPRDILSWSVFHFCLNFTWLFLPQITPHYCQSRMFLAISLLLYIYHLPQQLNFKCNFPLYFTWIAGSHCCQSIMMMDTNKTIIF